MYMVRHDDEFVDDHAGANNRCFHPRIEGDMAERIKTHSPANNLSEQHRPLMCADRDEIRPSTSVIVLAQPNRLSVMPFRVVTHRCLRFTDLSIS